MTLSLRSGKTFLLYFFLPDENRNFNLNNLSKNNNNLNIPALIYRLKESSSDVGSQIQNGLWRFFCQLAMQLTLIYCLKFKQKKILKKIHWKNISVKTKNKNNIASESTIEIQARFSDRLRLVSSKSSKNVSVFEFTFCLVISFHFNVLLSHFISAFWWVIPFHLNISVGPVNQLIIRSKAVL